MIEGENKIQVEEHNSSEPWPEQWAHKHVVLERDGKRIYIAQKDKGYKVLQLIQEGWEIVEREDWWSFFIMCPKYGKPSFVLKWSEIR